MKREELGSKVWKLLAMVCIMAVTIGFSFVNVQAAAKVKMNVKKKTIRVDSTYQLKLKNAKSGVTWKSSNNSVVTVDSKGMITGKKKGKAIVTATYKKKSYSCQITVWKKKKAEDNREKMISFDYWTVDGREIDNTVFAEAKITMINFWEPWCGPCCAEIPEIEQLYQDYKDKGFNVIGVFGCSDYDIDDILDTLGMTYTLVLSESFANYNDTGYVPCTVFVDDKGYLVYPEKIVGGRSYDSWYSYIKDYVK